jgi:anti-sigma-K factor RskA
MRWRSTLGFLAAIVAVAAAIAAEPSAAPKKHPGRQLVIDLCSSCHELERITYMELSREEWHGLIKGMLVEGAAVTDEEVALVLDYLTFYFGKKAAEEKR